ncbi:hypothetical protein [Alistipes finegoldii]|uniref:hypothetical protein n=1 Tax=Alistipes finegoldii TaxID=214856 RepID=UPI003080C7C9
MFKSKKTRAVETAIEHLSATLCRAAESLAAVADDVRASRAEIRRDYISGGWTSADLKRRLIVSKMPDGYVAVICFPTVNGKRMAQLRVLIRVDGDQMKSYYGGREYPILPDPLLGSITFPGFGIFYRDDLIFG